MDTVYIIEGWSGQYENWDHWIKDVFSDKEKAKLFCIELNKNEDYVREQKKILLESGRYFSTFTIEEREIIVGDPAVYEVKEYKVKQYE